MNYTFKIEDEKIKERPDIKLYTGNVNSYIFNFEFSDMWNGLLKFAVFTTDKNSYTVLIENDMLALPQEILETAGICQFGLFATNADDNIRRISTNLIEIEILQGAYTDGETPQSPTPDIWELLLNNNVPKIIDDFWHIYNPEEKKFINTGICAKGATPIKGVDYFTTEEIEALGINEKQDKANLLKVNDIENSYEWFNSPLLSDDHYPSAAFITRIMNYVFDNFPDNAQTYNIIKYKEDTANKVLSIGDNASDDNYPSEKAVLDFVNSSINTAILDSWEVGV